MTNRSSSDEPDRPAEGDGDTPERPNPFGVDARLLEILVCPLTKTPLRLDREHGTLISDKARLAFPIRDGVPILLESEATALEE